jgi:hypothetical protein
MERSSHGLVKVLLTQHLSGGTEGNHEKLRIIDVPNDVPTEDLPKTNLRSSPLL